jgi:small subunit ribosomal protein S16
MVEPNEIKLDHDKIRKWMEQGARPTQTVKSLLDKTGFHNQAA